MTAASWQRLPPLVLAALGVVFGDIGTSPLHAFREAFAQPGGPPLTPDKVFPGLSMIFRAVTVIGSLQYVTDALPQGDAAAGGARRDGTRSVGDPARAGRGRAVQFSSAVSRSTSANMPWSTFAPHSVRPTRRPAIAAGRSRASVIAAASEAAPAPSATLCVST